MTRRKIQSKLLRGSKSLQDVMLLQKEMLVYKINHTSNLL